MKVAHQSMGQHGFSLVELLVALTILTVGLFALAGMQSIATNKTGISHKISVATSLARETLDDLLARDPSDPVLNPVAQTTATYPGSFSVQGAGSFTITYTVTPNTPATGTSWIVVRVLSTSGGMQAVTLSSYKRVV